MFVTRSSYVAIDGIMYPEVREWHRWVQRQQWLCWIGRHYFLPAGSRQAFNIQLCVCGRCGYSTWWTGHNWTLLVRHGYWKQVGRAVPSWSHDRSLHSRE
jgi:hypothetical protein